MGSERLNTFHDASGLVTVSVFRNRSSSPQHHHHDHGADVAEDMVAIGGGGRAQNLPNGALLTASYPNSDLSSWLVSSKDHVVAEPHFLTSYAIGLKIQGMSRENLLSAIHVNTNESGWGQHPEASATMPGGFLLVSGGFKADWTGAGHLATASFPASNQTWTARSKDHDIVSPANLRVFAIGLREQLPGVGEVLVAIDSQESGVAAHPASVADMTDGFALTGGGAVANWHTQGSLLWRLEPVTTTGNQEFGGSSKDHIYSDPCTITTFALGIRIVVS